MKSALLMFSAALAVQVSPAARADARWTVTDAVIENEATDTPRPLDDRTGVYGLAGRRIDVRNIHIRLDPDHEATLYRKTTTYTVPGREYSLDDYRLSARFRFSYDVYDASSDVRLASEDHALLYSFTGSTWLRHWENSDRTFVAEHRFEAPDGLGVFSGFNHYPSRITGHDFAIVGEAFPERSTLIFPYYKGSYDGWALAESPLFYDPVVSGPRERGFVPKVTLHIAPVPEPETYAMLLTGVLGLGLARRFGRKTAV